MNWKNPAIEEPKSNKDYLVRLFFKDGSYINIVDNWRASYKIWCSQSKEDSCEKTRYCELPEYDNTDIINL